MSYEREFEVLWGDDDQVGLLSINLTDEGVIADIIAGEEVVGTWAMTAQELTEMIHEGNVARKVVQPEQAITNALWLLDKILVDQLDREEEAEANDTKMVVAVLKEGLS